jgi:DNA polymerase V
VFALIDGNSFYCFCERAFDPTLHCQPVVVLANNDGCVIARTTEAKELGLKMGEPWHLASRRPELKTVITKTLNYVLYGNMSRRVFDVLSDMVPRSIIQARLGQSANCSHSTSIPSGSNPRFRHLFE